MQSGEVCFSNTCLFVICHLRNLSNGVLYGLKIILIVFLIKYNDFMNVFTMKNEGNYLFELRCFAYMEETCVPSLDNYN